MQLVFYIHSAFAVIAMAFAMTLSHTVHALLAMVSSLLCLAISMYILSAPMAAALEVIVYAGAIMVLFAFCIMLLQIAPPGATIKKTGNKNKFIWALFAFVIFWGELSFVLRNGLFKPMQGSTQSIKDIASQLFLNYGFMIELASMLLLAGLAGAVYVGEKMMNQTKTAQEENL